ncbi:MAG: hypothetical protein M3N52_01355 [Actinomycetota bacterium]|nr:hypothetical protein [Actinomycetota bacterium]
MKSLIKEGELPGYPERIRAMVASGEWHLFDDVYAFERIRRFAADAEVGGPGKVMADALLNRTPPHLIDHYERLAPRSEDERRDVTAWTGQARRAAAMLADEYGISAELLEVTEGPNVLLTKVGAPIELGATTEDLLEDEARESVKILRSDGSSQPVTKERSSLMHLLSDAPCTDPAPACSSHPTSPTSGKPLRAAGPKSWTSSAGNRWLGTREPQRLPTPSIVGR